jgi:hypothetical protein
MLQNLNYEMITMKRYKHSDFQDNQPFQPRHNRHFQKRSFPRDTGKKLDHVPSINVASFSSVINCRACILPREEDTCRLFEQVSHLFEEEEEAQQYVLIINTVFEGYDQTFAQENPR